MAINYPQWFTCLVFPTAGTRVIDYHMNVDRRVGWMVKTSGGVGIVEDATHAGQKAYIITSTVQFTELENGSGDLNQTDHYTLTWSRIEGYTAVSLPYMGTGSTVTWQVMLSGYIWRREKHTRRHRERRERNEREKRDRDLTHL